MESSVKELEYQKYADYTLINDNFPVALDSLISIILFNKIPEKDIKGLMSKILSLNKLIV